MRRLVYLISGIVWFVFLGLSYFIQLETDSGENYIINDTLLGIIIFHNPYVLGIYIAVGIFALAIGSGVRFLVNSSEKH